MPNNASAYQGVTPEVSMMHADLEYLSEHSIYPGHPLVIALLILHLYPNLEAALVKSERTEYPHALSNGAIPGAGGNVWSGIDVLRILDREGLSGMNQALARADDVWTHCDDQKVKNPKRWEEGQSQADRFKERFKTLWVEWAKVVT